jgi:hypothetical protein
MCRVSLAFVSLGISLVQKIAHRGQSQQKNAVTTQSEEKPRLI